MSVEDIANSAEDVSISSKNPDILWEVSLYPYIYVQLNFDLKFGYKLLEYC